MNAGDLLFNMIFKIIKWKVKGDSAWEKKSYFTQDLKQN